MDELAGPVTREQQDHRNHFCNCKTRERLSFFHFSFFQRFYISAELELKIKINHFPFGRLAE